MTHMTYVRTACAATIGFLLTAVVPIVTARAEPATVLFVLDGSGSMWATLEGERRNKLSLVSDSIRNALSYAGRDTNVGLVAFGHRRPADCSDVETLVAPDRSVDARFAAAMERFGPRGRGPLTSALREAARQLPRPPAAATVVLIHDDYDNCQLDPCSALAEMQARNPEVVVNVVSVAVRREDAARLMCLPTATGGRHYDVRTASQIAAAIEDASKRGLAPVPTPRSTRAAPPAPAQPDTGPPPAKPGLQLTAVLVAGGEPIAVPLRWRVVRRGPRDVPVWEGDAAAPLLELTTGRYQIEAWLGFVKASEAIDVQQGTSQLITLDLRAGLLNLPTAPTEASPAVAAALADVVIALKRTDPGGESIAFQRGLVPRIALVPGNYAVSLSSGAMRYERTLAIRAGQITAFDPALAFGEIELSVVASASGPRVERAQLSVFEDDPDAPLGRREIWRSASSPATVALPGGTYQAVARRGAAIKRERITIRPGVLERRTLSVDSVRLKVTTRVAGSGVEITDPISYRLERLDGDKDVVIATETPAVLDLPAGRYRIESRIGLGNAIGRREVELEAGNPEEVTLELAAGAVRLRLLDASGAPVSDVAWDIRDNSGRVVWSASQTEARPLLLAGRYIVKAEARDRRVEHALDIRAGETKTLDLTGP